MDLYSKVDLSGPPGIGLDFEVVLDFVLQSQRFSSCPIVVDKKLFSVQTREALPLVTRW